MSQYLYYTSAVNATTLASSLSNVGSPSVNSVTGFPSSYPFKLLIDWGLSSQEAILVTSAPTGTGPYTVPCIRGVDGTTAQVHSSGAQVVHGFSGDELNILSSLGLVVTGTRFGADPTGTNDSTAAIQAALNTAAQGQPVYLPPGTYKTTSPLTLPPGSVLLGGSAWDNSAFGDIGTTIKPSAGFTGTEVLFMTDSGSAKTLGSFIRNIAVDGASLAVTADGIRALDRKSVV